MQKYETHQGCIEFNSLQHISNPDFHMTILRISGFPAFVHRVHQILVGTHSEVILLFEIHKIKK